MDKYSEAVKKVMASEKLAQMSKDPEKWKKWWSSFAKNHGLDKKDLCEPGKGSFTKIEKELGEVARHAGYGSAFAFAQSLARIVCGVGGRKKKE